MPYILDWKTLLLKTHLGLMASDISATEKMLGKVPFNKPRGNEFAPGLHHICYPAICYPNYGGIDFPCIIHNEDTNRETIFIVGEAPRRNKYAVDKNKPCSLGSPYGIIFKEYPDQCWVYKQVFKSLLDEGYNLYLTDAKKLWTKPELAIKPPCDFGKMLIEEINDVKPVKIVTFGRSARDMIREIRKESTLPDNLSHLYHPSPRNYDRWLDVKGVNSIDDIPKVIVDKILKNVDMFKP